MNMSQTIPGGRQRSSSDGDILDEGFSCAIINSRSSGNVKEASNDTIPGRVFTKHHNKTDSIQPKTLSNHVECDEDAFNSDGGLSSLSSCTSSKSKKRTRRLSFKSMRKAVSRAFVKEGKVPDQNVKTSNSIVNIHEAGKIWTPDLRRLGKGQTNMNEMDGPRSILSSARPLITDPDLEMTVPKWKRTPGIMGIFNHANSCFMNAVLQCLSNTDSFTEYFVQEFYKRDLKQNKSSRKSTFRSSHGEVTEQLGQLLSSLWCGKYQSDVSKTFKGIVAKVNNQYHGDDQHDAQEFLLWLLDRIHEDVCSVVKRKIKQSKNSSFKSDEEQALEALSVNGESFIVKLFQALHSSTLTCPSCGDRSRTFDPYLCVSLPLPQRSPRVLYINVVFLAHSDKCVKIALILNHFDTVRDLRESISIETRIPVSQVILCQLTDKGFGATYSNEQPLTDIADNETVYAIETHMDKMNGDNSDTQFSPSAQVLVLHVEKADSSSHCYRFGPPCLLKVSRDIKWKDLQREMLYQMGDAVRQEIFPQKLSNLFMIQIWDGSSHNSLLSSDVEMPLYTQAAERSLDTLNEDFGPLHIKILAIWNPHTKSKVIQDDREHITEHMSVGEVQENPPSQTTVSLDECFRLYTQEEKLIGEDAWMCPHCKQLQQGTVKSLGLWSLPDILILHLKRFKQTGLRRSKLNTLVDFPVDNFDMSPHLAAGNKATCHSKSDESTYDLVGVCNHYGNMAGGHYTAFCRSPVDGKWREFNDTKVKSMESSAVTKEAYLLFYQRRSLSKDINQKLFTGDHWVFSLPLSQEEKESSSTDVSPREEVPSTRAQKTRSRSTSPSLRRQSNGPSRRLQQPSTPQPVRRPAVLSYYEDQDDDEYRNSVPSSPEKTQTRQSRPLQRQLSSPGDTARRGKSANAIKSPSRGVFERRNDAEDAAFAPSKIVPKLTYREQREMENGTIARAKNPVVTVIKHTKDKESISTSSALSSLQYRNERLNHQNSVGSTASSKDSGLRNSQLYDQSLESDAKYPKSVHIESDAKYPKSVHIPPSHKDTEKENRSGFGTRNLVEDFELTRGLQVNLDSHTDPYNSNESSKSYNYDSSHVSSSGEARRRLAELMRQNSDEKQNGLSYDSKHSTGTINRRYQSQTSYDKAKRNLIDVDHLSTVDDLDIRGLEISNKTYKSEDYRPHNLRDRLSYPPRHGDEEYFLYSNGPQLESSLRSQFHDDDFVGLAQKHFGDPHSSFDSYSYSEGPLSSQPGDSSLIYQKYATLAKSREIDTSHSHHYWRDIPRSSTDQNISYSSDFQSLPVSSTSPFTYKLNEPSAFSPPRLTDREINAIRSYDRRVNDLPSSRLPSAYATRRFFRPRGVWGVNAPKATKLPASKVPTPCLRESSV